MHVAAVSTAQSPNMSATNHKICVEVMRQLWNMDEAVQFRKLPASHGSHIPKEQQLSLLDVWLGGCSPCRRCAALRVPLLLSLLLLLVLLLLLLLFKLLFWFLLFVVVVVVNVIVVNVVVVIVAVIVATQAGCACVFYVHVSVHVNIPRSCMCVFAGEQCTTKQESVLDCPCIRV